MEPFYGELAKKFEARAFAEAKAEGMVSGTAKAVIVVLEVRGLSVSQPERETILDCRDLEQVHGWLPRALRVDRTAELFD